MIKNLKKRLSFFPSFKSLSVALVLAIAPFSAQGSATRSLEADVITSADHTKTWTMPAASGTLSTGSGGTSGPSLRDVEMLTESSIVSRAMTPATFSGSDYISEPFIQLDGNRVTLSNSAINIAQKNLTLTSTNLTGTIENQGYLKNAKSSLPINWSVRFNTQTVFDVASGTNTTTSVLTSVTNRATEIYNATNTTGWFVHMKRSSTSLPWVAADTGTRVTVSAASYASSQITITHTALGATLCGGACSTTDKYIFVQESATPIQFKIAAGSYATMTPSELRVLEAGVNLPSYVHSYWKMDGSGTEYNSVQPSGYDLTKYTTPNPASAVGILGTARGPYNITDTALRMSLSDASNTVFDGTIFAAGGWFKLGNPGVAEFLLSKVNGSSQGWRIYKNTDNKIYGSIGYGAYQNIGTTATYTDSGWHYVMFAVLATSGANNMRLYVDGSLAAQAAPTSALQPANRDMFVGVDSWTVGSPLYGLADEIEYWNTMPTDWATFEGIISARWNGGSGAPFGAYAGFMLKGTSSSQSASLGDLWGIMTGLFRTISTVSPTVNAVNAQF